MGLTGTNEGLVMVAKSSAVCSKQSNDSYMVKCPEIKGCFTQGTHMKTPFLIVKIW